MTPIGPYSRPLRYEKLDGRTWEAKLLSHVRRDMTSHVGGSPSVTQRALIDRAAWLTLHIAQIDRRTGEGQAMTEHDSRTYLAWTNSLTRLMRQLGMTGAAQRVPSLRDHIASRAAA